jgi:hypothetical protein
MKLFAMVNKALDINERKKYSREAAIELIINNTLIDKESAERIITNSTTGYALTRRVASYFVPLNIGLLDKTIAVWKARGLVDEDTATAEWRDRQKGSISGKRMSAFDSDFEGDVLNIIPVAVDSMRIKDHTLEEFNEMSNESLLEYYTVLSALSGSSRVHELETEYKNCTNMVLNRMHAGTDGSLSDDRKDFMATGRTISEEDFTSIANFVGWSMLNRKVTGADMKILKETWKIAQLAKEVMDEKEGFKA